MLPRSRPSGVGIGESITVVAPSPTARSISASAQSRSTSGRTAAQRNRIGSCRQKSAIHELYARASAARKPGSGMSSSPSVIVGKSTLTATPCSSISSTRRSGVARAGVDLGVEVAIELPVRRERARRAQRADGPLERRRVPEETDLLAVGGLDPLPGASPVLARGAARPRGRTAPSRARRRR